ncbi:HAD-IC family P-type ATPase, partial [bacterium]|nr:HAD-IC family P-type ATPase [bacterium]
MEALEKLSRAEARTIRGGRTSGVDSRELVPGDVVLFEAGDTIAADMRILEANKLEVNESALTGESVPVQKTSDPLEDEDTPLAERANMLYNGTSITRGSARAVVIATGMDTELGSISEQIREAASEESTPLEKRLNKLGHSFIWLATGLAVIIILVGWLQDKDLLVLVETAVALAVAAVPEGLPFVAIIALARGMVRLAEKNALINRLSAVETLGGAGVIFTDKTGTLTENRMTVRRLILPDRELDVSGEALDTEGEFREEDASVDPNEDDRLATALRIGALCSNASLGRNDNGELDPGGDPMEVALLVAAAKAGMERQELLGTYPEVREAAFDHDTRMMATIHEQSEGQYFYAVKGAPEAVLQACDRIAGDEGDKSFGEDQREQWRERSLETARNGLRVLAFARKQSDSPEDEAYTNLSFVGLVGLIDPPRDEVRASIKACHDAGVEVVMVTGDQVETARAVGRELKMFEEAEQERALEGRELKPVEQLSDEDKRRLRDTRIFARVSPSQKLDLIALHQEAGAVVAMTGDGVNDAPALEKADIGVAMGRRGTQVAREAADMILKDDAFSTIVTAIEHGRVIFSNIRKFVRFLLTVSLSMILLVFAGSLFTHRPMPIGPLQILFLNAVTFVFPALALGMGKGCPGVMKQRPRDPSEPILPRSYWYAVSLYSVGIAALATLSLIVGMDVFGRSGHAASSVSFMTLTLAQIFQVFNVRRPGSGLISNEVTRNPWVWGAVGLSLALLLTVLYVPFLANAMQLVQPGLEGWALTLAFSLPVLLVGQVVLEVQGRGRKTGC